MDTQNVTSQVHMLIDFYMASYYNIDRGFLGLADVPVFSSCILQAYSGRKKEVVQSIVGCVGSVTNSYCLFFVSLSVRI